MDLFLILSTFGLGLRHGVDWDHIAAITDITGAEPERRRSALLAFLYALGHGAAVIVLGGAAIAAGERLPTWIDPFMERLVGLTLLVLAGFLVRSLWRGDRARISRGALLFRGLKRTRERLRRTRHYEIEHHHPDGPDRAVATTHIHAVDISRYTVGGAIAVGLLHGVGAETGTQAIVLVSASRVESTFAGLVVLVAFAAGIVATTGFLALGTAFGWSAVSGRGRAYTYLTVATAAASALVGALFVTGHTASLPTILA